MSPKHAPRRYPRLARVNEVVREALGDELERLSDPRLGIVTITGVDVSADLRQAIVYYSALGRVGKKRRAVVADLDPEQRAAVDAALHSAAPHLQAALGRQVRLKYTPELVFRADPAIAEGNRIDEIIRALHRDDPEYDPLVADDRGGGRPVTVQDPHAGVEQSIVDAATALAGARDIALACHVNPDGDALGSMLGLFHVLRAAGRAVVASFPTPFVIAPHYRELPGLDLLTAPGDFPSEPDVMVTFDCGSSGRLGDLEPAAKAARELVVLDHHVSNTRFGTINVIDPGAAASGVLVRRLLLELGMPLTNDAAVALYAALVCDTGRFQYETTSPSVFDLARELVTFDVPVSRLSRQLFEEHRFAYLKLLGEALATAELDESRRFVWTIVSQDMLHRHGVELEEIEGLIDILRRATEAEVTCVLKQDLDGSTRVSLRSLGGLDVREIAVANGGGGHRFAAGFESDDPATLVLERIRAAIPVAVPGAVPGVTPGVTPA